MNAMLGALASILVLATGPFKTDDVGIAFHPADASITLFPGEQSVVTLYVEPSAVGGPLGVELSAAAVEWRLESDGTLRYLAPGTTPNSPASWISMQPATIVLVPGEMQRLRVAVRIPRNADPGLYRTGVKLGSHVFRMTLHVLAPSTVPKWRAVP